jgi:glucose/arabinose dehydrogenase
MRATVMRYNLDGSGGRIFAKGLRNSVGLAFHPTTGQLWATNNDRDDIGRQGSVNDVAKTDSLPPERINILADGKNYGWPACYLPGFRNPEYPTADCSTAQGPAITFTAHSAPLGLAFYTGTMFPTAYQGDVLVTLHGSWNRSVPTGAKVVRVHVQNGVPVSVEDFVLGWQLSDYSRWGRPADVLVLPDGSVLITDDLSGRIWRVTYGN